MRARRAFLLAGILLLVACGESFTEPDAPGPMDEATAMAVAAAVVEANDDQLAALRRGHRLLGTAEEAFEAKNWRRTVRAANASAELSREVLDGLVP